jgi:hypothetical protein
MLIVVALVAAWGFATLVGQRFAAGDGYPVYSSVRADPLGTKAIYDSLARMPGTTCERNYKKLDKLTGAAGKTLVLLHVQPESFSSSRDVEVGPFTFVKGIDGEAVMNFAAAGGRVLITLDGQTSNWDVVRRAADARRKETIREKKKDSGNDRKGETGKGADEKRSPKKEDKTPPQKEPSERAGEVKELDPDMQDLLAIFSPSKSLRAVLGVKVSQREHLSGDEAPEKPEVVPGTTLDARSLPVWRSRSTLLYEDYVDDWDIKRALAEDAAAGKKSGSDSKKPAPPPRPKRSSASQWTNHALAGGGVVLAERHFSTGSVIVATDGSFMSNEALAREPSPKFLAWLVGDAQQIIFDETHLGTKEDPGIMALARKHNLHGLFVGGLILFALFVWRSSLSLVPADETQDDATQAVSGHGATAGLVSLLKRGIPRGQVMAKSFETWEKTATRRHASMQSRIAAARGMLPPRVTRVRKGVLSALYQQICEILHPRRNSRP